MSTKSEVLSTQRCWADNSGRAVNARGYLSSVSDNLYQPLSGAALAAFSKGSGGELTDTPSRPAKMKALHSSSALAVNVFDYWCERSNDAMLRALGLEREPGLESMAFESQLPTGLGGNPPNLDLLFRFRNGSVVGLESKFTEWFTPKPAGAELFRPVYFSTDGRWAARGLHKTEELARMLHAGTLRFRYLDAAQLLKHALGLSAHHQNNFELYYLYFDSPGPESLVHRDEIYRFSEIVSRDFGFHAQSYQQLYGRMREVATDEHAHYLKYLGDRYF